MAYRFVFFAEEQNLRARKCCDLSSSKSGFVFTVSLLRTTVNIWKYLVAMSQLTPEELLTQLKLFTSKPPESISTDPDLRKKLFYAAQDFMLCCEDNPNPVPRVALTNVELLSRSDAA